MATIAEVVAGSYSVETRVHSVRPGQLGHFNRLDHGNRGDLSQWFAPSGCTIERDNCAPQDHATCRLTFIFADDEIQDVFGVPEIPWSSMRLRPSMKLVSIEGRGETDWYNLGVFIPETPTRRADESPKVYDVDCHDLISMLSKDTGGTVIATGGQTVQTAIEGFFNLVGPDFPFPVVPDIPRAWARPIVGEVISDRQWILDEDITWLLIIDQLLEMVGWRPPWVNEEGNLTSDRWENPEFLATDLVLTDDSRISNISLGASNKLDVFGVPNRWVFIRSDFDPESEPPVVDNGIVVRNNENIGPSSQNARGRIASQVMRVDVADQAALEAFADRLTLRDRLPAKTLCVDICPQPMPWHRGIVDVTLRDLGYESERFIMRSWSLPLDGGDASIMMDGIT